MKHIKCLEIQGAPVLEIPFSKYLGDIKIEIFVFLTKADTRSYIWKYLRILSYF